MGFPLFLASEGIRDSPPDGLPLRRQQSFGVQEAIAHESGNRSLVARIPAGGDGTKRLCAPLAERALEPRLLAQRLVTATSRGTQVGQWTFAAARDARQADRGAEIEERLRAGGVERLTGALLHPADVRVDRQHVSGEREVADRRRGVRADAGQRGQIVGPAAGGDDARRAMEVERAAVVAESLP